MQRYKNLVIYCYHRRDQGMDRHAFRKLLFASILCLMFMIFEVVGGLLANSLAIATDAAHLLADLTGFIISMGAVWLSSKPPTRNMTFGWYRAVLGAVISVMFIWVVTGTLLYWAIERIISSKSNDINASIMLVSASIGIIVNIVMGVALHVGGVAHGHSHGHVQHGSGADSHHSHCSLRKSHEGDEVLSGEMAMSSKIKNEAGAVPVAPVVKQRQNINVQAAIIHVIGDLLQSIGVFIAALIIFYKPEYEVADPMCTLMFSVIVVCTTLPIAVEALTVLLEGKPPCIDFKEVLEMMTQEKGVRQVHRLRIWALSVERLIVTAHIIIHPKQNGLRIMDNISQRLNATYNIFELTLQTERLEDDGEDLLHLNPQSPSYQSMIEVAPPPPKTPPKTPPKEKSSSKDTSRTIISVQDPDTATKTFSHLKKHGHSKTPSKVKSSSKTASRTVASVQDTETATRTPR
ncbi:proton-coupled zinc antiporter SLC30A2-like isoform X2 [Ornithodoros turicata]|uniref:proton-coupled zinc antiporter SLC30A2-like isoform X2 n=1 Tax=Ornithodoros turicata TaxID=34597 RepID=UPI0031399ACA